MITINCLINANDGLVIFVTLYDKSEAESISLKDIRKAFATLKK